MHGINRILNELFFILKHFFNNLINDFLKFFILFNFYINIFKIFLFTNI